MYYITIEIWYSVQVEEVQSDVGSINSHIDNTNYLSNEDEDSESYSGAHDCDTVRFTLRLNKQTHDTYSIFCR